MRSAAARGLNREDAAVGGVTMRAAHIHRVLAAEIFLLDVGPIVPRPGRRLPRPGRRARAPVPLPPLEGFELADHGEHRAGLSGR